MFIILVVIRTYAMTCLYSLSGNTTVGGLGALTFSFSTPNLASFVDL